jgi:uncharacterized protein YdhG (YjbR/CyaY superfamily)
VDELLKKLNHKPPAPVTVLEAPAEARPLLSRWSEEADVRERLGTDDAFVLTFVRSAADIQRIAPAVAGALTPDGVLWMAYPKKSSKRYRTDVSRGSGWQPLGDLGFEAVRQVAIDDDWSALRFRPVAAIKRLERASLGAISAEGKRRTAGRSATATPPVVTEYLASLPPERQAIVAKVDEVIRAAAPELDPARWGGMLGYGHHHYRYTTGREGDTFVVGLASQKQCVSLYLPAVVDDRDVAEANADRLGKVSVGKSCVRFKKIEDLDLSVVSELVRTTADVLAGSSSQG